MWAMDREGLAITRPASDLMALESRRTPNSPGDTTKTLADS